MLRQRVVFMMTLGLINCGKARVFGSLPGILISQLPIASSIMLHWHSAHVSKSETSFKPLDKE